MKITIHGKNLRITDAIKNHIDVQFNKLTNLKVLNHENDHIEIMIESNHDNTYLVHSIYFVNLIGRKVDCATKDRVLNHAIDKNKKTLNNLLCKIKDDWVSKRSN